MATELNAGFLETSAKAKIRVDEAFEMLAQVYPARFADLDQGHSFFSPLAESS